MDEIIDRNKIEALMEKGVLRLTLNIKESQKPRKIKINTK
ncbi:MAG: Hsp20 family protein [Spirochaetaceae bacterium]|nr:Hsp20 family protein [Spirochaetaceae bacterium]